MAKGKSRVWAIKLGSGGRCIAFCERHKVVGLGWSDVDTKIVATSSLTDLAAHVREACKFYRTERERGSATGQLFRFGRECQIGDYVLYYDPPKKYVRITRVTSHVLRRDFEPDAPDDIFQCRRVEYVGQPIPILDFYGALKGSLLGPRLSFWELHGAIEIVERLARGERADAVSDPELEAAYLDLSGLIMKRAEVLNEKDWEWLAVDYFKAQGAHVDERRVGGSNPIIDIEARFDHGELGGEVWRIQVKRWQDRVVDWPTIQKDLENAVLDSDARFCFVSVYGFTDDARAQAEEEGVLLLEAADFTRFLLSGRVRERIRAKMNLPMLGPLSGKE